MSDFTYNLPDVGEGLSEGEIVHWHVAPGDTVAADQIIVDVQINHHFADSLMEESSNRMCHMVD